MSSIEALKKYQDDVRSGKREKPKRKSWAQKAKDNPKSLKSAIAAKCWDCVCGDYNERPRKTIAECLITDCSLWQHRPYKKTDRKEI